MSTTTDNFLENYTDPVRWFGNTYAIIVKKVVR